MAEPSIDEDLAAELIKFNAFLEQDKARQEAERAARRAQERREEAARELKRIRSDPNATREQKEAAEKAWKDALAAEDP